MSIMRASLVFASLCAAQAACTGAGCAVEDEVSLLQVQVEQHGVPDGATGGSCEWTGKGDVPSSSFICAKCPKVLQVAAAAGYQLEVKRDPKALFTKDGKCFERATMTDASDMSATGQQFQCSRDPDFEGPCTADNQDSCVCHLGTKGEGMTFKEMVAGFKATVKQSMTKDEEKNGGDFSHSEEEGQICNWDGSGDTPNDKFICDSCPKVKKVMEMKAKLAEPGTQYEIQHPKSSDSLYTSDAECFEVSEMVNKADPTETPTNFQCRRSLLFSGPCTEANEKFCECALGLRGDGATFEALVK